MQDKRAILHLRAGDLRGVKLRLTIALEYSDYTPLILSFAEQWAVPVPNRIWLTTLTKKAQVLSTLYKTQNYRQDALRAWGTICHLRLNPQSFPALA